MLFYFWWHGYLGFIPVALVAIRDFLLTGVRFARGVHARPLPASPLGKLKTATQFILIYAIFLFLVSPITPHRLALALPIFSALNWVVVVLAWGSAFCYLISGTLRDNIAYATNLFIATCGGLGLFPTMPGTIGSLASLALWYYLPQPSLPLFVFLVVSITLLGCLASNYVLQSNGAHDPSYIVVDELLGMLLVVFGLPRTWLVAVVGFIAFRFFDIRKPWPIKKIEMIPGCWGIMLDDVAAALCARAVLLLVLQIVPYFS